MDKISRRRFLTTTGGLVGILATGIPPARGQQRQISYLCWNNFAPASDKKLAEIGQRFTKDTGIKLIAQNRKARHDYHLDATYEAGMVLSGTEVKSLREGRANLTDGWADIEGGEVWLHGVHIPEYAQGTWTNHTARRKRKLLLHRREIDSLYGKVREKGLTLVPTRLYFKDGRVKVELALARARLDAHALVDGVEQLERVLLEHLPEGEALYPDDFLTDQPERSLVAETVREKLLQHTRAELPFSTAVSVDKFDEENRERLLRLYCTIYVEQDSQKGIVIGRGGEMLKRIGTEARHDLEQLFETKVFLDLRVKVNADWRNDDRTLDELGVPRTARRPSARGRR